MLLSQINIPSVSTRFTNSATLAGDFVSRAMLFIISAAGLYFFYQLIISGISYMTSVGDEVRLKQLQKQLVNAIYGLLIVVASYFIMQIVQKITGTNILG